MRTIQSVVLDMQSDWIQSTYRSWVYGYNAQATINVTVVALRTVLRAAVTRRAYKTRILPLFYEFGIAKERLILSQIRFESST